MEAAFIADWDRFWVGVETDIQITLGIQPVQGDEHHVKLKMPFKPEIGQATGVFSAGALIQLADVAATWLCLLNLRASGAAEGTFPFAVQLSANLVSNTDQGAATADARLTSAGRTVMVTHTEVHADDERLLLVLSGTHILKAPRTK